MTRTETAVSTHLASIAESLAQTRANCSSVRLRASCAAARENMDMIGRLSEICDLWVEMARDAERPWVRRQTWPIIGTEDRFGR